jgi:hypothetical protein
MKPTPKQDEIGGAAQGQPPAGFSDGGAQRNDDGSADERNRNQNEHGECQCRDEVAGEHPSVGKMREHVRIKQRGEPQLVGETRPGIGRRRQIEIEAGCCLVEQTAVRSINDALKHG